MNNFDKLHQEQDEFIKKTFQEDKVTSQPVFDNFTNYIEHTNIKQKKYTYKQRKIIMILLLLLIISVCINIFLALKTYNSVNEDTSTSSNTTVIENITKTTNNSIINSSKNELSNTENSVKVNIDETDSEANNTNTYTPSITVSETNFSDIDLDELKNTIENYSYAIQRISYDEDNLESNTILLIIAKKYFDSNSPKNSSQIAKFAQTAENVHAYLKELTGKDFSNSEYIQSYNNYIGYTQSSKSYVYGSDYATITKENYSCSDVKVTNQTNDTFTAEASVTRTLDNKETNYTLTFTFKINENYTYQKYCITSLKSKNTSFYPDNTVHFIDTSAVEEGEN